MRFLAGASGGGNPEIDARALPGSNINTGWLDAVLALERTYGDLHRLSVKNWRYRFVQTTSVYVGHYVVRQVPGNDLRELQRHLTRAERVAADLGIAAYGVGRRLLGLLRSLGVRPPMDRAHELLGRSPQWAGARVSMGLRDVIDVFEAVESAATVDPAALAEATGHAP